MTDHEDECVHELPRAQCDWCKPRPRLVGALFEEPGDVGPWFPASFPGRCASCGFDIDEDDELRYRDGQIECRACADD